MSDDEDGDRPSQIAPEDVGKPPGCLGMFASLVAIVAIAAVVLVGLVFFTCAMH